MTGYSNREISERLYLSIDAVNKRLQRAREKIDVKTNEQMIYKLIKKRYISP